MIQNHKRLASGGAALLLLGMSASAHATAVVVPESGDLRPSSFSLDPFFSLPTPPTVFGSSPTATALGVIRDASDVDWYSFTGMMGTILNIDIDNHPYTGDITLGLFNSAGTLLAFNDDSFPEDPGTAFGYDSFLGEFTLPYTGTYYFGVAGYANFPTQASLAGTYTSLVRPDSAYGGEAVSGVVVGDDSWTGSGSYSDVPYTVHVSLPRDGRVPDAGGTLSLLSIAAGGLGLFGRRSSKR